MTTADNPMSTSDLRLNEMTWRFAHEDDSSVRLVISKTRKFNIGGDEHARILLQEVIEDWAWNEPGQWDGEGTDFNVVVLQPQNMAGEWKVRVFASPCVSAERVTPSPSTSSDEGGR